MIEFKIYTKTYIFKRPSGTSRGILTEKKSWFIELNDPISGNKSIGECSVIEGLNKDFIDAESYANKINEFCKIVFNKLKITDIDELYSLEIMQELSEFPSILIGVETALLKLNNNKVIFKNDFTLNKKGIPINGLIWMGDIKFLLEQIEQKLKEGFTCLKMKIGAISFDEELEVLKKIRRNYNSKDLTLRVDANGAFSKNEVIEKLKQLATYNIHSIEQPIAVNQLEFLAELCKISPIPIALDEELIGINNLEAKKNLLASIKPHFIVLKPSLHGGFYGTRQWIELAESFHIPWWITSALESNVGLSAIAQFTGNYPNLSFQGLGTGGLYTNNEPEETFIKNGEIFFKN